ncbi:hypothetical protein N0V85_003016 [Neurospora sp. IMI 360204]|nr:hypothetical protein N0V85_003016 [Neurospora sp. IMI 360204]
MSAIKKEDTSPIKKEEGMPRIKKDHTPATKKDHTPITKKEQIPVIKKEPGTEESLPLHVIAQANPETKSAKRKAKSEREGERLMPLKKPRDTEMWQYLMSVKPDIYMPRCVTKDRAMRDLLQLFPRKRDLPEVWKTRLALEGAGPGNLRLIFAYLVGDYPGSAVCANCAEKWLTVDPTMAASLVEGSEIIYKAAAFPGCILFPKLGTSGSSSVQRECVNAVYRESKDQSMPEIWSSSAPAPACDPASLRASSLAEKKKRSRGRAGRG